MVLPLQYYRELILLLKATNFTDFITFDDLVFPPTRVCQNPGELRAFLAEEAEIWKSLKRQGRGEGRCDVLIHHDTDSGPKQSIQMAELEVTIGIRSSIHTFSHINIPGTQRGSPIVYSIDFQRLRLLQDEHKFSIGYHCNAAELAGYTRELVPVRFREHIQLLSDKGLMIRFFSPHGGAPGPNGENNHSCFYPTEVGTDLIWTHNRFSPSINRYTDGGFQAKLKRGDIATDVREFFSVAIKRGGRCAFLIHPQYYFSTYELYDRPEFRSYKCEWFHEYWSLYRKDNTAAFWKSIVEGFDLDTKGIFY